MERNAVFRLHFTIHAHSAPAANNNNNQNPILQMRARAFEHFFMRIFIVYAKLFPPGVRMIVENAVLILAILSLCLLAYIHAVFIHTPMNCLDPKEKSWPREGILRIEILQKSAIDSYTLEKSYAKEARIRELQGYTLTAFDGFDFKSKDAATDDENSVETSEVELSELLSEDEIDNEATIETQVPSPDEESNDVHALLVEAESAENLSSYNIPKSWIEAFEEPSSGSIDYDLSWAQDVYIVEYSLEYGYLRLSPKARKTLNISIELVTLDPHENKCFGNWFTQMLLENVLGYDDMLMASVRKLAQKEDNKGFIRNVVTDYYFRFVNITNRSSYIFAGFIMLIFTLSISMLLRYSHHQIFIFIVQLLRLLEFRTMTHICLAPLLTVIMALVGMEAIMSEFFSDPSTSFYVIMIVWLADQYDAICCRSLISRRHWLRFFFLYHFAFYAYDYRFRGEYSDLALFTTCCFIVHSMLFFFHHYELPAVLRSLTVQEAAHRAHQRPESGSLQPFRNENVPNGHFVPPTTTVRTATISQQSPNATANISDDPPARTERSAQGGSNGNSPTLECHHPGPHSKQSGNSMDSVNSVTKCKPCKSCLPSDGIVFPLRKDHSSSTCAMYQDPSKSLDESSACNRDSVVTDMPKSSSNEEHPEGLVNNHQEGIDVLKSAHLHVTHAEIDSEHSAEEVANPCQKTFISSEGSAQASSPQHSSLDSITHKNAVRLSEICRSFFRHYNDGHSEENSERTEAFNHRHHEDEPVD